MPPAVSTEWTGLLEAPSRRRAKARDRFTRLAERVTGAMLRLEAGRSRRAACTSRRVAFQVVLPLLLGATALDFFVGPEIEAGFFYVLPIMAACLLLGRWGAALIPVCLALFHFTEIATLPSTAPHTCANDLMKLGTFSMVASLTLLARLFYLDLAAAGQDLVAQRQELDGELALAARLQACLYNVPPEGYRDGQLVIHARCRPVGIVGGDLCHLIPHEGGVNLFVGDVIGKGVPAALIMSMCTAILARFSTSTCRPGQALAECNRLLSRHFDQDSETTVTATAFFGTFRTEADELIFSLAGHEAPILLGDAPPVEAPPRGLLMGAQDEAAYPEARVPFGAGAKLVVFTDGAVEIRSPWGEELGRKRLESFARRWAQLPAPELAARLVEEIDAFAAGAPQRDDLALVVVEREG